MNQPLFPQKSQREQRSDGERDFYHLNACFIMLRVTFTSGDYPDN